MNIAIVLSGGNGTRTGLDMPKQYIKVGGRMIISYCLLSLFSHEKIDGIVIVANPDYQDPIKEAIDNEVPSEYKNKFIGFANPGKNRQLSIYSGLLALKDKASCEDTVFIHDAARPNLSAQMISSCIDGMEGFDGVLPVLPMKDTVYYSDNGTSISSLVDRSKIYAGQAPEAFLYGKYMAANEALLPDKILVIKGSTEPAIMAGMNIKMIDGDENNYKITTLNDLEKFRGEHR